MQHDENIINELIKRYKYLYDNKELILSMCIKKGDKKLKDNNYYLYKDIDKDIINSYKEFLLSDKNIEETSLYTYIEFLKNNNYFLDIENNKIDNILQRRKNNMYLRNVPTFTVWKIITYVRKDNADNQNILNALDVYYNLERYMLTGINWNSGYELDDIDIDERKDELSCFPSSIITTEGDKGKNWSFMAFLYTGNNYEEEDNFLYYDLDKEFSCCGDCYSKFTSYLDNMGNLSIELKESLYKIINYSKIKVLKN